MMASLACLGGMGRSRQVRLVLRRNPKHRGFGRRDQYSLLQAQRA